MAKLEGVKVIDAVGGEIKKVSYDGAEYTVATGDAKVGDLVLCVNESSFFTEGAFYLTQDVYEGGGPRMKDDEDDYFGLQEDAYVLFRKISAQTTPTIEERVEELEAEVAQLKALKPKFSVGDYVKIVKSYVGYEGEIAKITGVGEYSTAKGIAEFEIEHIPKKNGLFAVTADQIVKATDDEVTMAKEKAEEIHKWAKIGRKVNEFKKGDVVRVLAHARGRKVGEIGTVENSGTVGADGIGIRFGDGAFVGICRKGDNAELIAPVDARFDK